ncbi:MAG: 4Fe-4S binding protein, partial [Deferribacteraceae bacterium]|nr:4Fe-4S binding protein [Deferribacteraceae bacterium]
APNHARGRHVVVEERLLQLQAESESFTEIYNAQAEFGIITSGIPFQYVQEALPDYAILKLGMVYPLPMERIRAFASTVKKLYVVEELDPIIETELKAAGVEIAPLNRSILGELSTETVSTLFGGSVNKSAPTEPLPQRPPNMCAGCSHRGIFYAINRLKLTVTGDIGCYTLGYMEPLSAVDSCVCMGASVSMAHGFDRGSGGALAKSAVAVIGDSTFLHTGINGLINSVYNQGASTVIIMDNRITGMTGHQANPGSGIDIKGNPAPQVDFEVICRAVGVKHVQVVDPFDVDLCMRVLKEETARPEVSVIITNRPCIFADKAAIKAPYAISTTECCGCKACLRIGCPAISWREADRQAYIDPAQCTGCGLCPKVCRFNAISQRES